MRIRTLTTIGLGLVVVGCQPLDRKDVSAAGLPASSTCAGYGIGTDTKTYTTCVAYQESRAQPAPDQSVPPFRLDQYNNRVDAQGYRVDGTGRRMSVDNFYNRP
jgi:hypothetical protein